MFLYQRAARLSNTYQSGVQNTLTHVLVSGESLLRLCAVYAKIFRRHIGIQFQLHCRKCRSRFHRGCGTAGPDLCWRWPSRLVATAEENSQRWAFEAVATWLSANAAGDITSATRQSLRLWSLAYD